MKRPLHRVVALFGVTLLLATVEAAAQTKQTTNAQTQTLTLGLVFQGSSKPVEERFRPLVDYAARRLSSPGEFKGMVVTAPTPGQMMKLLDEKRVDFYMDSPYATYLINRLGAARLLLRRWRVDLQNIVVSFSRTKKAAWRVSKICAAK
jgi:ABC-type phosphate/phosphonate transport system substrate-binding protein